MLAIIEAKKRVLGQTQKWVYYLGDVQEDGFIYFNDDVHYRCKVKNDEVLPANQSKDIDRIQFFQPKLQIWTYSNHFTQGKAIGFSIADVYQKIKAAQDRADEAWTKANNAEQTAARAETKADNAVNTANLANATAGSALAAANAAQTHSNNNRTYILYNGDSSLDFQSTFNVDVSRTQATMRDVISSLNQAVAAINAAWQTSIPTITGLFTLDNSNEAFYSN